MPKIKILFFFFVVIFFYNNAYACIGLGCYCTIATNPLNIGLYDVFSNTHKDATGSLSVTCGGLVLGLSFSYNIHLSTGASGNFATRTLKRGANNLNYNLFTNATRTTVWGNGSAGTGFISNSYLLTLLAPRTDNFSVYARIPRLQNVGPGVYTDTIVGTVIF